MEQISPVVKLSANEVCKQIDEIVKSTGTDYLDAVVHYSEKEDVEIEVVAKLLSPKIKQAIGFHAQSLNLLPKTSRLPLEF